MGHRDSLFDEEKPLGWCSTLLESSVSLCTNTCEKTGHDEISPEAQHDALPSPVFFASIFRLCCNRRPETLVDLRMSIDSPNLEDYWGLSEE